MPFAVIFSNQAKKDAQNIKHSGLKEKTEYLLNILANNPFQNPPPYEKLLGNFKGSYSRRINLRHRLIYQVDKQAKEVRVLNMWTHYE